MTKYVCVYEVRAQKGFLCPKGCQERLFIVLRAHTSLTLNTYDYSCCAHLRFQRPVHVCICIRCYCLSVFCDCSCKFPGWTQGWSGPGWRASLAQTWLGSRHSCTLGLVRCELRWRREENTQVEAGSSYCIHTHKHQEKNDSLKGQREL